MGLAPLRGSRGAPQGRPAEGRRSDDLRAYWSGFMAEYLVDMRVGGDISYTCTACGPMFFWPNMVGSSAVDIRRIYILGSEDEAVYVSPMADWDSETPSVGVLTGRRLQPVYHLSAEGETIVLDALVESSDAPGEIPVLDDVEDVLRYLRSRGLDDLAGDLEYKKCIIEEDSDELPISPESVREFAGFVSREPMGSSPNVIVDSNGYVGLEWIIPDQLVSRPGAEVVTTERGDDHVWGKGDGVLGLWFLPSGMVRVCGTSGPVGQGIERMRVNSIVPPAHVMSEVMPFLSRLERA